MASQRPAPEIGAKDPAGEEASPLTRYVRLAALALAGR